MMLQKKHIIALTSAACLFIGAAANAAVDGAYIGGTIGYGKVHQGGFAAKDITVEGSPVTTTNSSKDTGLAGRGYVGYQFNQNAALEAGYSRFHNATAKASSSSPVESFSTNGTIKTDAFDIVGKGIIPIQNGFSVYGKAGLALLRATGSVNGTDSVSGAFRANDSARHIYPTFGLGAAYDVTKNLVADVSWMRIQKTGSSTKLQSTDMFGAGLAYNFG